MAGNVTFGRLRPWQLPKDRCSGVPSEVLLQNPPLQTSSSPALARTLKCVLQRKLDLTIIGRGVGDACTPRHIYRDCRAAPGQPEVGMIEQVEEFCTELHLLRLSNLEVLL